MSNPQRVAKYVGQIEGLDLTGVSYPVKVPNIPTFEHRNQISINVFGYEKGEVIPVHITTERFDKHVNLLLISDEKKPHYCWIQLQLLK